VDYIISTDLTQHQRHHIKCEWD